MSGFKLRVGLLGLCALLLVGAYVASAASAGGGPYFYHRTIGSTIKGVKISEAAPEKIEGSGGEQRFSGKVSGTETEVAAKQVQVKGIIYNTANQAQAKIEVLYVEPKLVKPALSGCEVKVGASNILFFDFWLVWKWNGTFAQLGLFRQLTEQRIDGVLFPLVGQPIFQKAEEESEEIKLKKELITELQLGKANCGVLENLKAKVSGQDPVKIVSPEPESFSQTETFDSEGPRAVKLQHICFWWFARCTGFAFIGLELGGAEAEYKGEFSTKNPNQEDALYE